MLLSIRTQMGAVTSNKKPDSLDGFYIGFGAQYTHTANKIDATDGIDLNSESIEVYKKISHQTIDRLGGLAVVGYGRMLGKFYFGGEGLVDLNVSEKTDSTYEDYGYV